MTGKDEPVVMMATDLMLAASQQGLDLNIGEAGIILGYLEGHEYCLVVDGKDRLLRQDEQTLAALTARCPCPMAGMPGHLLLEESL